ncbi:Elongation factor P-like protein [Escherichia coli]|nr:Elongation factor P-like protein [Escherichia coli]
MIQVPEYLSPGEKIRIHIEERRYMGVLTNFSRMQKRDSSGCPFFNLLYQSSILRFLNTLRPQFSLVD